MERKLAAILAADVAGYSRLMEADEEGTLAALRGHREIVDGMIAAHRGRVFNTAGDSVIAEEMTGKLVAAFQSMQPGAPLPAPPPAVADPIAALSPREQQILREIAHGASNKEIARTLDIAETTVKAHVTLILRKLGVFSRTQAVLAARDFFG